MHLLFVSLWVDFRDTPGEFFFETIQNPWVESVKLMSNSPALGGNMNTPNIISKFDIEMN